MDASGNIRPLTDEDPLREGEVRINRAEKRRLEKVAKTQRAAELERIRDRAGKPRKQVHTTGKAKSKRERQRQRAREHGNG